MTTPLDGPRSECVEIVAERLFVVGRNVPLDGSASWAPASPGRFQPTNCYVLAPDGSTKALVVDPGLPLIEKDVVSGLRCVVPSGEDITVFLTRAQFDTIGNLGAVAAEWSVPHVFTGGVHNPFDSFDAVTSADAADRAANLILFRSPEESRLKVINTTLRILATFWAYDDRARTLFTSDTFTHATVANESDVPIVDDGPADLDEVRTHLFTTLWWVPYADTDAIADDVERIFQTYDVEVLAPSRGCVIRGRDAVKEHAEALVAILREPAVVPAWL